MALKNEGCMIKTCQKITLADQAILLGIVLKEYSDKIHFKTRKREYLLDKKDILSIKETHEIFQEED